MDQEEKSPSHNHEICWGLREDLSRSLDVEGFLTWDVSCRTLESVESYKKCYSYGVFLFSTCSLLMVFILRILVVLHRMTRFRRRRAIRSVNVCQGQFLLLLFFLIFNFPSLFEVDGPSVFSFFCWKCTSTKCMRPLSVQFYFYMYKNGFSYRKVLEDKWYLYSF